MVQGASREKTNSRNHRLTKSTTNVIQIGIVKCDTGERVFQDFRRCVGEYFRTFLSSIPYLRPHFPATSVFAGRYTLAFHFLPALSVGRLFAQTSELDVYPFLVPTMSAYEIFNEALASTSNPERPSSSTQQFSSMNATRAKHIDSRSSMDCHRASVDGGVDGGKFDHVQAPPNSPDDGLPIWGSMDHLATPAATAYQIKRDSIDLTQVDSTNVQGHQGSYSEPPSTNDPPTWRPVKPMHNQILASYTVEPTQSRAHNIDHLFSDAAEPDVAFEIDSSSAYDPALGLSEPPGICVSDVTPYEHSNPDLVHLSDWQPHIPSGEDGWSQQSQAGSQYPGTPLSVFSRKFKIESQPQTRQDEIQYLMSGALPPGNGRQISPTEPELIRTGFEFHNEVPEEVQIAQFSDKAFRKTLHEIDPDLPRKAQWHAWNRVTRMLEQEESNGSATAQVDVSAQNGNGNNMQKPYARPASTAQQIIDTRATNSNVDHAKVNDSNIMAFPKPFQREASPPLPHGFADNAWSWNPDTINFKSPNKTPAPLNAKCFESSNTINPGPNQVEPSRSTTNEDRRYVLVSQTATPEADMSKQPGDWLISKIVSEQQSRRESKSDAERFLREQSKALEDVMDSEPTQTALPFQEEACSQIPLTPTIRHTSPIPRPDTPRPFDQNSIRQSVEPETPRRLLVRESTPAFEDRSPSPSPPSHTQEDVNMTDAPSMTPSPNEMSTAPTTQTQHHQYSVTHPAYSTFPPSSPHPISSPIHATTAPQTPYIQQTPTSTQANQAQSTPTTLHQIPPIKAHDLPSNPKPIPIPPIPTPRPTRTPKSAKRPNPPTSITTSTRRKSTTTAVIQTPRTPSTKIIKPSAKQRSATHSAISKATRTAIGPSSPAKHNPSSSSSKGTTTTTTTGGSPAKPSGKKGGSGGGRSVTGGMRRATASARAKGKVVAEAVKRIEQRVVGQKEGKNGCGTREGSGAERGGNEATAAVAAETTPINFRGKGKGMRGDVEADTPEGRRRSVRIREIRRSMEVD